MSRLIVTFTRKGDPLAKICDLKRDDIPIADIEIPAKGQTMNTNPKKRWRRVATRTLPNGQVFKSTALVDGAKDAHWCFELFEQGAEEPCHTVYTVKEGDQGRCVEAAEWAQLEDTIASRYSRPAAATT